MAKITFPKVDDLKSIARKHGFKLQENKAFVMVWHPSHGHGNKACYRLYLANGKELCRAVHLSGFGKGWVGTEPPPAPNGRIQAHLDLGDDRALAHFEMVLIALKGMAPEEQKKKDRPMASSSKRKEAPKSPAKAKEAEEVDEEEAALDQTMEEEMEAEEEATRRSAEEAKESRLREIKARMKEAKAARSEYVPLPEEELPSVDEVTAQPKANLAF